MFFSKRENWLALLILAFSSSAHAASSVWRVASPRGETLYLGGSFHALRSVDYPLPPEFNHAFDASSRLAFEVDPEGLKRTTQEIIRLGKYPAGDSVKNHVDPRTYEYVRRVFALLHLPEKEFASYRPWLISFRLEWSSTGPWSHNLGVEEFLLRRARANKKTVVGLESAHEHAAVFADMTDVQAEATLLITFLPRAAGTLAGPELVSAWRRGDIEVLSRSVHDEYRDYPAIAARLLDDRNRRWIPKIESYIASGQTYFVVVGGGHIGGSSGLLTLLRGQGYRIEQL